MLKVMIGRKYDEPLANAYEVKFTYEVIAATADYFQVRLKAKEGPLGTTDFRIMVEAVPLNSGRTFLHMSYSYNYGFAARVAMEGYLATIGRNKVGFTVIERSGEREYIGGVRGVVERNAMRYYLAIEPYLDTPASQQVEKRLGDWYDAVERYPVQLHELDRNEYLEMKRREIQRQQELVSTGDAVLRSSIIYSFGPSRRLSRAKRAGCCIRCISAM